MSGTLTLACGGKRGRFELSARDALAGCLHAHNAYADEKDNVMLEKYV